MKGVGEALQRLMAGLGLQGQEGSMKLRHIVQSGIQMHILPSPQCHSPPVGSSMVQKHAWYNLFNRQYVNILQCFSASSSATAAFLRAQNPLLLIPGLIITMPVVLAWAETQLNQVGLKQEQFREFGVFPIVADANAVSSENLAMLRDVIQVSKLLTRNEYGIVKLRAYAAMIADLVTVNKSVPDA